MSSFVFHSSCLNSFSLGLQLVKGRFLGLVLSLFLCIYLTFFSNIYNSCHYYSRRLTKLIFRFNLLIFSLRTSLLFKVLNFAMLLSNIFSLCMVLPTIT
jgi:hypothetical protein